MSATKARHIGTYAPGLLYAQIAGSVRGSGGEVDGVMARWSRQSM
jgi:hypothetical protein